MTKPNNTSEKGISMKNHNTKLSNSQPTDNNVTSKNISSDAHNMKEYSDAKCCQGNFSSLDSMKEFYIFENNVMLTIHKI